VFFNVIIPLIYLSKKLRLYFEVDFVNLKLSVEPINHLYILKFEMINLNLENKGYL